MLSLLHEIVFLSELAAELYDLVVEEGSVIE